MSQAEELGRTARAELLLPFAGRPSQIPVNGPGAEPDVSCGNEEHLQTVGMGQAAEPDQGHGRDIGSHVGKGLHGKGDFSGGSGIMPSTFAGQQEEKADVGSPDQNRAHGAI